MDVHKNTIVACLINGRKKEIRNFKYDDDFAFNTYRLAKER